MNLNKQFLQWINGCFFWDDIIVNGLVFVREHELEENEPKSKKTHEEKIGLHEITFKEEIDITEKLRFRKFFLRKCLMPEVEVITLQDVKDVVLFTADPKHLTEQYIEFLHIPTIDSLLRAFIIYFQFYFLVYNKLMHQRKELEKKIKHPNMVELECNIREDLSDLRSMVSREYCSLLVGAKESLKFHHMSFRNGVSLSDRDRRLIEVLIKFSCRVIWYGLHKPQLPVIESEVNRLIRSTQFNKYDHQNPEQTALYDYEKVILKGVSDVRQPRLLSQSPLGKEVILADHDYRMLAVGQADFPPNDKRKIFLELAYMLPEEHLVEYNICVGILGMKRADFDIVLKRRRKKSKNEDEEMKKKDDDIKFHFKIPPRREHCTKDAIRSSFAKKRHMKEELFSRKENRGYQCQLWKDWINCPNRRVKYEDVTTQSMSHISTTALYI